MKEGSFQPEMTGLEFTGDADTSSWTLKSVPLPNQLPQNFDFSKVPQAVIKSSVVDALMSQNDDLMSRLGVALRRVALLEEKLSDAKTESEQFKAQTENLKDQILVLREKSRTLFERKERNASEFENLKEQIQLLEIRYSELYTQSQTKEAQLVQEHALESRELKRLRRYRQRVARAAQSLKKSAYQKWEAEMRLSQSEKTIDSLRVSLNESAQYIQSLTQEHKTTVQTLVSQYESQVKELTAMNSNLGEKAGRVDALSEQQIRLENQVVLLERREQEEKIRTAAEISDLQKALTRYRNEAKELALELENSQSALTETQASCQHLTDGKKALEEQVENLQILWKNQQLQIEKEKEKVAALQKLNQELSIAINQYRRDLRDLKQASDPSAHL